MPFIEPSVTRIDVGKAKQLRKEDFLAFLMKRSRYCYCDSTTLGTLGIFKTLATETRTPVEERWEDVQLRKVIIAIVFVVVVSFAVARLLTQQYAQSNVPSGVSSVLPWMADGTYVKYQLSQFGWTGDYYLNLTSVHGQTADVVLKLYPTPGTPAEANLTTTASGSVNLLTEQFTFTEQVPTLITISSGDMIPTLDLGDLVVVGNVDPNTVTVGTIIIFHSPYDYPTAIVHRVIAIDNVSGQEFFETKGDNNPVADMWRVPANYLIGEYLAKIPYLGLSWIDPRDAQVGFSETIDGYVGSISGSGFPTNSYSQVDCWVVDYTGQSTNVRGWYDKASGFLMQLGYWNQSSQTVNMGPFLSETNLPVGSAFASITRTYLSTFSLVGIGAAFGAAAAVVFIFRKRKTPQNARLQIGPDQQSAMMFCRECGARIPRTSKHCSECGANLV